MVFFTRTLLFHLLPVVVWGRYQNFSDTNPDGLPSITFLPHERWVFVKSKEDCSALEDVMYGQCTDVRGVAYEGSFHQIFLTNISGQDTADVTVQLKGTGIWIYGIQYGRTRFSDVDHNGNFTIAYSFTSNERQYQPYPDQIYQVTNVTNFNQTSGGVANISNGLHTGTYAEATIRDAANPQTINIHIALNGTANASIIFDRFRISGDDLPPNHTPAIAGGTVGGVVGLLLVVLFLVWMNKRSKKKSHHHGKPQAVSPEISDTMRHPVKTELSV
ncbi:hypothetical protein DL96DRAFT_1605689 [Flagelloscypha sp. PMI_526]|nr:hypothetical protein DL96DRAFT_1605689 [Flagelloscypha sp. PMI_526]